MTQEVRTTIVGLRVPFFLEVTFLLNLICSNTIVTLMPEWSILGKSQVRVLLGFTLAVLLMVLLPEKGKSILSPIVNTREWRRFPFLSPLEVTILLNSFLLSPTYAFNVNITNFVLFEKTIKL